MSATKFLVILPEAIKSGDKVRIQGKVADGAEQFAINFANEITPAPNDITYHFKWKLSDKKIVENYKTNGHWVNHVENDYTNTLDGSKFALEFAFRDDTIYVYLTDEDVTGHNMITQYEPEFNFSDIASIQVWDDVEKITKLTFIYD